jgi:hypothetical protein
LGITTTLQWRLTDPLLFTGFDEQLHMRTLIDIASSHSLFQSHPTLEVSPRYPGLESVAALFQQLGLPMMPAATVVVLVARLVLVLVLCDAVEHLTGSPRAGGLAVAVYAMSAQFVFFNSQFAYQTLALPLALAAVAFIVRARRIGDPRLLLAGASVCLLAVAVTHHVTSLLTAVFLVFWTIAERDGRARQRVFYGAVVAVAATTTWAVIQWSLLRNYFGPIVDDEASQVTGGMRRAAFSDSAGFPTPTWERVLLVYYAAAVTFVVLLLILICARSILRRVGQGHQQGNPQRWEPRVLLVLMVAMIPVGMAARVVPSWGELADRSSGFLFLPLSLLVADGAVRWSRSRSAQHFRTQPPQQVILIRWLALVLATGVFVGGHLLGSGANWARLPGGYLASADSRSMDAETLAAVRWARDGLPTGSRIGADRVSSVLLASQSRLWPVMKEDRNELYVPSLYFADEWGPPQSELVRRLHLRFLYVDRRFADQLPHLGSYFYKGETSKVQQLTREQLTKFDAVPGIHAIYRHGPISIYDLSELGVPEARSGWYGETRPISGSIQLVIGLLAGLVLGSFTRSRAAYTVRNKIRTFQTAAGPSLSSAAGVGALCSFSVAMLLAHIWLEPAVLLSAALVVLLANPRWVARLLKKCVATKRHRKLIISAVVVLVLVAVGITQSFRAAYTVDERTVRAILNDPAALHVPVQIQHAGGAPCAGQTVGGCNETG